MLIGKTFLFLGIFASASHSGSPNRSLDLQGTWNKSNTENIATGTGEVCREFLTIKGDKYLNGAACTPNKNSKETSIIVYDMGTYRLKNGKFRATPHFGCNSTKQWKINYTIERNSLILSDRLTATSFSRGNELIGKTGCFDGGNFVEHPEFSI